MLDLFRKVFQEVNLADIAVFDIQQVIGSGFDDVGAIRCDVIYMSI